MDYENKELEKAVGMAKAMGYRVWTWKKKGPVCQVFIDDGSTYGTISTGYFGGLVYDTCHKPTHSAGSGFRVCEGRANQEAITRTLDLAPVWARNYKITKETFADHIKNCKVLEYFEL